MKKGLTLVELLITMGISIIIGGLLTVIILNSAGLYYKESSKLTEGLNINDTLTKVRETIKESSSIATSYTQGSTTYTSGTTQLVLKVPSLDSSNNIISNTFDYFVFFLDTNKLRFKTFPDALSARKSQDQIFTTLLDSLSFKYLDNLNPPNEVTPNSAKKVLITIALKQKSGAKIETIIATSEAYLRND